MAWSVPIWKILRISQSQFLSGEVCTETRHSSYTKPLAVIKKSPHPFNNLTQQNLTNVTTFRIQRKTELNSRRVG